jgi:hypothetical protein
MQYTLSLKRIKVKLISILHLHQGDEGEKMVRKKEMSLRKTLMVNINGSMVQVRIRGWMS